MAKIYNVTDGSGSTTLPITDGVFTTFDQPGSDVDIGTETGVFVIAFYGADGKPVTPTGGNIIPEMSPLDGQWHTPSSGDAVIDATSVVAGSSTYAIPVFTGPAREGRMTLNAIAGAVTCRAYFWRF